MSRSIYTDASRPGHLGDKYRVYGIRFEDGQLLKLHISQPVTFKTFVETYIFQHIELATKNHSTIFLTDRISGIEKILNSNQPDYQITPEGLLIEISK